MIPPPAPFILDAQAISGITGSISLACWIIVFAPQIYENFTRKSSEGLSLSFIILWLAGDVFNVLGAVLQGVLPTMIILAIYYTLADIVLLWQCLIYGNGAARTDDNESKIPDLIHLSPANPLHEDVLESVYSGEISVDVVDDDDEEQQGNLEQAGIKQATKLTQFQTFLLNSLMVALVIVSGFIGWYISYLRDEDRQRKHPGKIHRPQDLVFDPLAQSFGWLCAVLYLGSRIPQIVLNYQRKSCEGISFMFFLFACLGNLTYVISILSIDMSWHYLWVNSSWLAGSLGTLGLDFTIFIQFFLYNENDEDSSICDSETQSETLTEPLLNVNRSQSYGTN